MVCDICSPKARGYTVRFSEKNDVRYLQNYFTSVQDNSWKLINSYTFWLVESLFFDLIDYFGAHLDTSSIYAVVSDVLDPLKEIQMMKPIHQFGEERESSWIDSLIENKSLCTYYQPIVGIEEGMIKMKGHELLSRGVDNHGGIIPPNKMFEAARIRNKVFALDRVCRLESVKNAKIVGDQLIFINFIPTAIYVPEHCLSTTFKLVKEMNIKPEQIVFEVVETDEVKDIEHLKSILNYYKSHGFKYALDDVGVGFNDLKKLEKMEPDFVKLALEFTNGVCDDIKKQNVAASVLHIAHEIGAAALAEGVEREEDLHFLHKMGYDLFQGYYIGKPQDKPMDNGDVSSLPVRVDGSSFT